MQLKLLFTKSTHTQDKKMHPQSRLLMLALFVFIACSSFIQVESQLAGKLIQNPCVNKRSCHDCIQTASCAWCMQPDHGDKPRCFQHSYSNICPEEYIWNPDTQLTYLQNYNLTRTTKKSAGGAAGGQLSSGGAYEAGSSYSGSSSSSASGYYGSSSSSSSSGYAASFGNIVQIRPQRVGLKLRISKLLWNLNVVNNLLNVIFLLFRWSI